MGELQWSREPPYHVARIRGFGHYAIEPHGYGFDLMGDLIPRQTFDTFADAKTAAENDHQRRVAAQSTERTTEMTNDDKIKHMVTRFLAWRLPETFAPDGGITFKQTFNEHTPHPMRHEPYGTNLFNFHEAEAMVRHMLEGLPADSTN